MDSADRRAIAELFAKIGDVERRSAPRDVEAERFIMIHIARQPAAPYYMAQTMIAQEQALAAAQQCIARLEQQLTHPPTSGGFLSAIFAEARHPLQPASAHCQPAWAPPLGPCGHSYPGHGSSGFLAGAAQAATGIAGGLLLGSMISDILDDDGAHAAPLPPDAMNMSSMLDDPGADIGGFDGGYGSGGLDDGGGGEF